MSQDYSGWSLSHLKSASAGVRTTPLTETAGYYSNGVKAMQNAQEQYSAAVKNLTSGWQGDAAGSAYDASMSNYEDMSKTRGNSDYAHSNTSDYNKSVSQRQEKVAAIEEPDTSVGGAISRSGGNPFTAASQYFKAQNEYKANQQQAAEQVTQMDSEGANNADTMRSTAWQKPGNTTWASPDPSLPDPPSRTAQTPVSGPSYNYNPGSRSGPAYTSALSPTQSVHRSPTLGGGGKPKNNETTHGTTKGSTGGHHGPTVTGPKGGGPSGGTQTGTDPTSVDPGKPPTLNGVDVPGGGAGQSGGQGGAEGSFGGGAAALGGAGLLGAGALGGRGLLGGSGGARGGSGPGFAEEEGTGRGAGRPGSGSNGFGEGEGAGRGARLTSGNGFGEGEGTARGGRLGGGFGDEGRLPGARAGVGGVPEEGLGARPGSSLAGGTRGFGGEPISGEAGRPGGYPMGGGRGRRGDDDEEAPVPDYLVETEDVWGNGTNAAPPVIGE